MAAGKYKLIVHADDFGLSEKVNEGIIRAHRDGIVTSASLMANGEAFESAIRLARCSPSLDVGIHLTLTEEKPLSEKNKIPSLLDKNNRFHCHATKFAKRYLTGKISLDEVNHELDAQIRKVINHGVIVSHLDSHQHIHMLPGIRKLVGKLAGKYSINAIRYPKESLSSYMLVEKGGFSRLIQLVGLNAFCSVADTKDVQKPDYFFGFFYGGGLTKTRLRKILHHLRPDSTCEIMCHPGVHDDASQYNHWHYHWKDELDALTDHEIKGYIDSKGVELISYADL